MTRADAIPPRRFVALVPLAEGDAGLPLAPIAAIASLAAAEEAPFDVVLAGVAASDAQVAPAVAAGALRVWLVTHPQLGTSPQTDPLLHVCAQALARIGLRHGAPALVLLPAGAQGEEIAARLAVRFDGVALGRCIGIECRGETLVAHRAAYGGRAHLAVEAGRGACFGAIRRAPANPAPRAPAEHGAAPGIERVTLDGALPGVDVARSADAGEPMRPLEGAGIVVAGGRGMQSEAGFALLHELAACLDAAVGGSLPAVDAGWVPVSRQVGQSGKYVTPRVYVAVGISGTPQHLAGVGPDTRIVAINNDAQADIFRIAEIGAVADWKTLLPPLLAQVRASLAVATASARAVEGGADGA